MHSFYHSLWLSIMALQQSAFIVFSQHTQQNAKTGHDMDSRSISYLFNNKIRGYCRSNPDLTISTEIEWQESAMNGRVAI